MPGYFSRYSTIFFSVSGSVLFGRVLGARFKSMSLSPARYRAIHLSPVGRLIPYSRHNALLLFSCDNTDGSSSSSSESESSEESSSVGAAPDYSEAITTFSPDDMFTDRDKNPSYDLSATVITLNGSSFECSSSNVSIGEKEITISAGGDYIIRGSATDCAIVVNASKDDKVCLVLDGASISTNGFASI